MRSEKWRAKSMIFAGVKADDPRVKAAVTWIGKNYDLKSNPGQGTSGLYYYYQTFAKSLDVFGESTMKDAKGVEHDWRKDLVEQLASASAKMGLGSTPTPNGWKAIPTSAPASP